jgi:perosamine synthetase
MAWCRPTSRGYGLINKQMISYGRQSIGESDIDAVLDVLRGTRLTQGPVAEQFEKALAKKVGAKFAVVVSSGTAALHIACLAAGMRTGNHGITSALTFVASANAMRYCGAEVSLTDIDPHSLGMDVASLEKLLSEHPESKVVIPVSFAGLANRMADIRAVAKDQIIIEDASHSLGGSYEAGSSVGSCAYSDMTVFSFHPVKPITTGEGGAVTTNDQELYYKLRMFRDHGLERRAGYFVHKADSMEDGEPKSWYYEQQELGFNYRLSDLHAALGVSQLSKLDQFIERRRAIAARYDTQLGGIKGIRRPQNLSQDRARSAHHIFPVEINFKSIGMSRAQYFSYLRDNGVISQVHYIPVYRQPYYQQRYGFSPDCFPVSEAYYASCLTLPIYPGLTDDEINHVVRLIRNSKIP